MDTDIIKIESFLRDNGDKVSQEDKEALEKEISKARETLEKGDNEAIKKAIEEFNNSTNAIVQKMYANAAGNDGGTSGGESGSSDGVDYNVKDAE